MFIRLRRLNDADKAFLAQAFSNANVKARIRKFDHSFRICFDGEQSAVLDVLNSNGYRNACGAEFCKHSFNQAHEIFIHGAI
jgi:hypothetical protein